MCYDPLWVIPLEPEEQPKPEVIQEAHKFIRDWLTSNVSAEIGKSMRIQYGQLH